MEFLISDLQYRYISKSLFGNHLRLSSDSSARHNASTPVIFGVCLLSVCIFRQARITAPSQHISLIEVTLSTQFSHRHVSMRQSQSSLSLMDVIEPYSNILMHTISQEPPKLPHSITPPQLTQIPIRLSNAKSCPTSRQRFLAGSHL